MITMQQARRLLGAIAMAALQGDDLSIRLWARQVRIQFDKDGRPELWDGPTTIRTLGR